MDIPRIPFCQPLSILERPTGFNGWLFILTSGGLLDPEPIVNEPHKTVRRRRKQDCALVLAPFQRPVIPPAAKLHPELAQKVQWHVMHEDHKGLGELLGGMLSTPEGTWRVHVDKSLGTYLFDIMDRLQSNGLLRRAPVLEAYDRLLMAACIIARSKGRDFVVPDYIKLAVLAIGVAEWNLSEDGINSIMDKVAVPAV